MIGRRDEFSNEIVGYNDWSVEINEISVGVYQLQAIDAQGRKISCTGVDPEILISEFRTEAERLSGTG